MKSLIEFLNEKLVVSKKRVNNANDALFQAQIIIDKCNKKQCIDIQDIDVESLEQINNFNKKAKDYYFEITDDKEYTKKLNDDTIGAMLYNYFTLSADELDERYNYFFGDSYAQNTIVSVWTYEITDILRINNVIKSTEQQSYMQKLENYIRHHYNK